MTSLHRDSQARTGFAVSRRTLMVGLTVLMGAFFLGAGPASANHRIMTADAVDDGADVHNLVVFQKPRCERIEKDELHDPPCLALVERDVRDSSIGASSAAHFHSPTATGPSSV